MSMAPSQLGAFVRSDPSRPFANLQYHVQPLSLRAYDQPIDTFPAFTASVCNLNPTSRGTVRIRSACIADPPRIAPNYLSTDEDRHVAAESLRVTRRIVSQPALARYFPVEHLPGAQFQTDEDLVREGGRIANTIFHPVGTARMGADRRFSRGARFQAAGSGRDRAARGRRQRDAHRHERQHQQPDTHDRREGGALDSRGRLSFNPHGPRGDKRRGNEKQDFDGCRGGGRPGFSVGASPRRPRRAGSRSSMARI